MQPQQQSPAPQTPNGELHLTFSGPVEDVTATQLMQQLDMLLQQSPITGLYIFLSTPGGSVNAGIMLHNYLLALPVEVSTHNIGQVDSIGNVVFLAGDKRYASPATSFLLHGVVLNAPQGASFTKASLRERLSQVEQDEKRIATIITQRSRLTSTKLTKFFSEGKSLGPDEALKLGIIGEVRDATHPQGTARAFFNSFPQN